MAITTRIDAITDIGDRALITPPIPKSVKIELSSRCDLKCVFCSSHTSKRPRVDMDQDMFRRLAREMRDAGVEELGLFFLNEPMLTSWLPDAIAYAKKECGFPYVFITTNGRLARPSLVDTCMRAGLDSLKFSLNHASPAQFTAITQLPGFNLSTILGNVRAAHSVREKVLEETGHKCGLYASSILYDGEQREAMVAVVKTVLPYLDQHYYLPLYGQAGQVVDALESHGLRPMAGNPGRVGALRKPLPCWACFTEGHITYDGKLSACCFDSDGRFGMADLTEVSFVDGWRSQKFQDLRAAHLNMDVSGTVCQSCIAYK